MSRWFNFEKVIEALVAKNVYHTNTVHLQTYAKDVCFIEDDEQFYTMLNFYHNLGIIVKHRSTVILKAQWLISLFKTVLHHVEFLSQLRNNCETSQYSHSEGAVVNQSIQEAYNHPSIQKSGRKK